MQHSITLPYRRTSPVHVPRRDLVLSSADSLLLTVIVVESDHPSAQTIVLVPEPDGGPVLRLVLWDDTAYPCGWGDYNFSVMPGRVLQSIDGTPGSVGGSWDFHVPTGRLACVPRRCGWAVLLLWEYGVKSSMLAHGVANFLRPYIVGAPLPLPGASPDLILVTDDLHPIIASDTLLEMETS